MLPEQRRAGRAIRKARREAAARDAQRDEALQRFADFVPKAVVILSAAMDSFIAAVERAAAQLLEFTASIIDAVINPPPPQLALTAAPTRLALTTLEGRR